MKKNDEEVVLMPCPQCCQRLKWRPRHAGNRVRCPRCDVRLTMPSVPDEPVLVADVIDVPDGPTAAEQAMESSGEMEASVAFDVGERADRGPESLITLDDEEPVDAVDAPELPPDPDTGYAFATETFLGRLDVGSAEMGPAEASPSPETDGGSAAERFDESAVAFRSAACPACGEPCGREAGPCAVCGQEIHDPGDSAEAGDPQRRSRGESSDTAGGEAGEGDCESGGFCLLAAVAGRFRGWLGLRGGGDQRR